MRRMLLLFGMVVLVISGCGVASTANKAVPAVPVADCPGDWSVGRTYATAVSPLGPITRVDVSSNECADQILIFIDGPLAMPAYRINYIDVVRSADGDGKPVPVDGHALELDILAPSMMPYSTDDSLIRDPVVRKLQSIREIRYAGTSGGETTLAIGVATEVPFDVDLSRTPSGTSLLIVNIRHS